jgi:hypothetical protein
MLGDQWKIPMFGGQWKIPMFDDEWKVPMLSGQWKVKENHIFTFSHFTSKNFYLHLHFFL